MTNDTSNQALWSVLGIDKAIDLPSALLVMPGKLGDAATKMYKYKVGHKDSASHCVCSL